MPRSHGGSDGGPPEASWCGLMTQSCTCGSAVANDTYKNISVAIFAVEFQCRSRACRVEQVGPSGASDNLANVGKGVNRRAGSSRTSWPVPLVEPDAYSLLCFFEMRSALQCQVSSCSFELGTPEDLRKCSKYWEIPGRWLEIRREFVGPKVTGIGIGNIVLGGGMNVDRYFKRANIYGLTIDNVVAYELVLPNSTVNNSESSDPDLFFGLRGGFNDFVCGALEKYRMKLLLTSFSKHVLNLKVGWTIGPRCMIQHRNNYKQGGRPSCPVEWYSGPRSIAMEKLMESLLSIIPNETLVSTPTLMSHMRIRIHVEDTHTWSYTYAWVNSDDVPICEIITANSKHLQQAAIAAGQDVGNVVLYPNHASPFTSLEGIYGENLVHLRDIKKAVYPDTVMGIAGGWEL
ncbi:hypothetical protein F4604DRAFT_1684132 [Suillus subluteus]|nr:hypothetical protein F4604DRAFT_1684132 [Suillus subluteus]